MEPTLKINEINQIPKQFNFVPSKSGTKVIYVSTITGRPEFYLYDCETSSSNQITHGEPFLDTPEIPKFFTWDSTEKGFYFFQSLVEAGGPTDIWYFNLSNGKAEKIIANPTSMNLQISENDTGQFLAFTSNRTGKNQLYVLDKSVGSSIQLTDSANRMHPFHACWIPNTTSIVYTLINMKNQTNSTIWMVDVITKKSELLLSISNTSLDKVCSITRSGKNIAITSDSFGYERVGVYNLESKSLTWFGTLELDETNPIFIENDNSLLTTRIHGVTNQLIKYNMVQNTELVLPIPQGSIFCNYASSNGFKLFIEHEDSIHTKRLLHFNLEKKNYNELLVSEFGTYQTNKLFIQSKVIFYPSTNQTTIDALLYTPKDLNKTYPAIIMVHGGPTAHFSDQFYDDVQLFVDRGFVVLMPNVRGSTGYGKVFRDCCINDWGGKDLEDIASAVIYLQNLSYVDKERIGITGQSYGGYLTNMAMTKLPNLFKAGSTVAGVSSMKLFYEKSKESYPPLVMTIEKQMGRPDSPKVTDLWEKRSPINFVDQMTGKLQIIHSVNDPATTIDQARSLEAELLKQGKREGKDFEYIELESGGHGSLDVDINNAIISYQISFFEKHLKK